MFLVLIARDLLCSCGDIIFSFYISPFPPLTLINSAVFCRGRFSCDGRLEGPVLTGHSGWLWEEAGL